MWDMSVVPVGRQGSFFVPVLCKGRWDVRRSILSKRKTVVVITVRADIYRGLPADDVIEFSGRGHRRWLRFTDG